MDRIAPVHVTPYDNSATIDLINYLQKMIDEGSRYDTIEEALRAR